MVYMFYKKLCVSIVRGHDREGGVGVGGDSGAWPDWMVSQ